VLSLGKLERHGQTKIEVEKALIINSYKISALEKYSETFVVLREKFQGTGIAKKTLKLFERAYTRY
jgi:hypothetical protein